MSKADSPMSSFPLEGLLCQWNSCKNPILDEPISLPCGHNYCRVCISHYLSGKCAVCSSNFDSQMDIMKVNTHLNTICGWYRKNYINVTTTTPKRPPTAASSPTDPSTLLMMGSTCLTIHFQEKAHSFSSYSAFPKSSSGSSSHFLLSNGSSHLQHSTAVNEEWMVADFIRRLKRKFPVQEDKEYGLYIVQKKKWLDEEKKLSQYDDEIHNKELIFYLKRVKNPSKKKQNTI